MKLAWDKPIGILLCIFYILCISTFLTWQFTGKHPVDGDEHHYLVIANGITKYRTFEQTLPYKEEFQARKIYPRGLVKDSNEPPTPDNIPAINGPNGLYSLHNIGLPLLLAIPFKVGGVIGAKLFLILISGLAVWACWLSAKVFTSQPLLRILSTASVVLGLPLIPAASQVYPDIPAGVIALVSITKLMRERHGQLQSKTIVTDSLTSWGVAFLPWLHIKFSLAALLISVSFLYVRVKRFSSTVLSLVWILPMGVSLGLLAFYNSYAFGKFTGPYEGNSLEVSTHSLMVLIGLYIDRFQGIMMQNPAFFLALPFLALFLRRDFLIGALILAVHGAFVIPNALHPNWYGGYSFAGRFAWSGAVVAMPAVIYGLVQSFKHSKRLTYFLFSALLSIQAVNYVRYTFFEGFSLYNILINSPIQSYPSFMPVARNYFPMLYDSGWAYSYLPNIVFVLATLTLLATGIFFIARPGKIRQLLISALSISFFLILLGGLFNRNPVSKKDYLGSSLLTKIDTITDSEIVENKE